MQHLRYAPTLRFLCKRQFGREQAEFLCLFDRFGGALGDPLFERLV
jgi:hypothetical protein